MDASFRPDNTKNTETYIFTFLYIVSTLLLIRPCVQNTLKILFVYLYHYGKANKETHC